MEPDRPQLDRPVSCVIAQQYSSTAFFSLRFNSRKERLAGVLKMLLILFFFWSNCLSMELRKSGSVCGRSLLVLETLVYT